MVPLYALLLTGLAVVRSALNGKAARTERRYARAALAAEALARMSQTKPGNGSAADPFAVAKRQYELGRLVDVRDRLGDRYVNWQSRADRVGAAVARLRAVKGRAVPYLLGAADVGLALVVLHYLGLTPADTADAVKAWAGSVKM